MDHIDLDDQQLIFFDAVPFTIESYDILSSIMEYLRMDYPLDRKARFIERLQRNN